MMLVDQQCLSLAEYFLESLPDTTAKDIQALAEEFQRSAEDACREVEARQMMVGIEDEVRRERVM